MKGFKIFLLIMVLNYVADASNVRNTNRSPFSLMRTVFDMKTSSKFRHMSENNLKRLFQAGKSNTHTSELQSRHQY